MSRHVAGRVLGAWFAASTLWLASASAQIAPTGTHYAGRATDTGDDPGLTNRGGYSTSVAFDFPAARGGLPIPVQVVSGTPGYGAAGVGWDVPLSYVHIDTSFVHRRPSMNPGAVAAQRRRVTVSLLGRALEMLPEPQNTTVGIEYIARFDPTVTMTEIDGVWTLYDGNGLTYTFHAPRFGKDPDPTIPGSSLGPGLALLQSIRGPGGSSLELDYSLQALDSGDLKHFLAGVSINLARVRYNPLPSDATCFKNEVQLSYLPASDPSPHPLAFQSISVIGSIPIVRSNRLASVDVMSRAACGDSPVQVRRYAFEYSADVDTLQDRLISVKMFGRGATADQCVSQQCASLPVGNYQYGAALTGTNRSAVFARQVQEQPFPGTDQFIKADGKNFDEFDLGRTSEISNYDFDPPEVFDQFAKSSATLKTLIDMTGDGRPDAVYQVPLIPNFPNSPKHLWIRRNVPGPNGTTQFAPAVMLNDSTFTAAALDVRTAPFGRFARDPISQYNREDIWTQTIDVNGDGRLDIIDAAAEPFRWVIYLNTPDSGPSGIKWERRTYDVTNLYNEFSQRHLLDDSTTFTGFLPLGRRFTGTDYYVWECWKWDGSKYVRHTLDVFEIGACTHQDGTREAIPNIGEKTVSEWEVKDINGDGYPDVVFNSTATNFALIDYPPTLHSSSDPDYVSIRGTSIVLPSSSVEAVLNVRGVFITNDSSGAGDPFSLPKTIVSHTDCGLALWNEGVNGGETRQGCGIADVNGDGLADRIEGAAIYFGTGFGFSSLQMSNLPDGAGFAVARQSSQYRSSCTQFHAAEFESDETAAVRDFTGDGIPDFVELTNGAWKLFVGTGAGFRDPVDITGFFALSAATESCDTSDSYSYTADGTYDLDGDGSPEFVALTSTSELKRYQLAGGTVPGVPEAGRLVNIDNGYGAQTKIAYRSAKQDPNTAHQIPSPEIVVSSVATAGSRGLGGSLATTQYAYGSIDQMFDPMLDAFRPTGYLRTVALAFTPGQGGRLTTAQITDAYPPDNPSVTLGVNGENSLNEAQRFGRYLLVGRTRDVTVLAGTVDIVTDPWDLLTVDLTTDSRRISGTHYEASIDTARSFSTALATAADCKDMPFPYDLDQSETKPTSFNPCSTRGFMFTSVVDSWRGTAAPPAAENVRVRSAVRSVDALGHVTSEFQQNDTARPDDDFCVDTSFATPVSTSAHAYNTVATQKIWNCNDASPVVYAEEQFEHDHLDYRFVYEGLTTSHTVYRHAVDTGAYLSTIREYDISYDAAGNPIKVESQRDDGATRTVTVDWDAFGLVPTHSATSGTNVPTLNSTNTFDPITDDLLTVTDENGTVRGAVFDEFGRQTLGTIDTPQGHPGGVLVAQSFLGFESCAGTSCDPLGRRVVVKQFKDPVAADKVAQHEGQVTTAFLDELGRARFSEAQLGADYNNEKLRIGHRIFDGFGRIVFEADPYPVSQSPQVATGTAPAVYGTTAYYVPDGSTDLMIRGTGFQPHTSTPDASIERFPTVLSHYFSDHQETQTSFGPDALTPGSPQFGVFHQSVSTAIGWVLSRSTSQNNSDGANDGQSRLEYAEFGYDPLGDQTKMVRYEDPQGASRPVESSVRFDSVGQILSLAEPQSALQERVYDDFGELTKTSWQATSTDPERSVVQSFDAFGRVIHSEEQTAGISDPETKTDYRYDVGSTSSLVSSTYVLGRLASATSPSGTLAMSYDGAGRVNARLFTDSNGVSYVERHGFHGDGSQAWMELALPDNKYTPERVDYESDTAGRVRWMWFSDGANTEQLYNASDIDPLGRLRSALFGRKTEFRANYANSGRRLPQSVNVFAGTAARSIAFTAFDANARELSRTEQSPNFAGNQSVGYDALGRLLTSAKTRAGISTSQWGFHYDPLGNILALNDQVGSKSAFITYQSSDRDRICRLRYDSTLSGLGCNVEYDSVGNMTYEPTRTGFNRLSYFNSGALRSVRNETGNELTYRYGPLGAIQEMDIKSAGKLIQADRQYGAFIKKRFEAGQKLSKGPDKSTFIMRQFEGPGLTISKRGAGGSWVFEFNEARGTRFTTDENGNFLQDLDYTPFGEVSSSGVPSSDATFTSTQWNEGEALLGFGLVNVGARVYDPAIGRFLSRDPVLLPRTSATTNPYAFAFNDPINYADPSGLDPCADQPELCNGTSSSGSLVAGLLAGGYHLFTGGGSHGSRVPSQSVPSAWNDLALLAQPVGAQGWNQVQGISLQGLGEFGVDLGEALLFGTEGPSILGIYHGIQNRSGWDIFENYESLNIDLGLTYLGVRGFGAGLRGLRSIPIVGRGIGAVSDAIGAAGRRVNGAIARRLGSWAGITTVYRVEGVANKRLIIDAAGNVSIKGKSMLFLNFGDPSRAKLYFAEKVAKGLEGATLKSFQVPTSYLEELRAEAVPQKFGKTIFPDRPQIVDPTKAADQYGLRSSHFDALKRAIIPGSGR